MSLLYLNSCAEMGFTAIPGRMKKKSKKYREHIFILSVNCTKKKGFRLRYFGI
jgi:hypothetical protein